MIEQQRVDGKGERHGREPNGLNRRAGELLRRDVELPEHGHHGPAPQHVHAVDDEERRDDEHRARGDGAAEQVRPAPRGRRAQAEPQQDCGDRGRHLPVVGEQRGGRQSDEHRKRGRGPHSASPS